MTFLKYFSPASHYGPTGSASYMRHHVPGIVSCGKRPFRDGKIPPRLVPFAVFRHFNFNDPDCLFSTHFWDFGFSVASRVSTNAQGVNINRSGLGSMKNYELVSNESDP